MDLTAKWIWLSGDDGRGYNSTTEFRRDFELGEFTGARIAVSADSYYRLKINGQWIADGPARGWPEHYFYDWIDVAWALRPGPNRIEAEVRYYGCGTFHQRPQRGGFLAELKLQTPAGHIAVVSDRSWQARPAAARVTNTAKISVQQCPVEIYDATRPEAPWGEAAEVAAAGAEPWRDLAMRDCRLLSRKEFPLKRFVSARRLDGERLVLAWSSRQIYRPGGTSENISDFYPTALALTLDVPEARELDFTAANLTVAVDGRVVESPCRLEAGTHLLAAAVAFPQGHLKEHALVLSDPDGIVIGNPAGESGKYALAVASALVRERSDIPWPHLADDELLLDCGAWRDRLIAAAVDAAALVKHCGSSLWQLKPEELLADDGYWRSRTASYAPLLDGDVADPGALICRDGEVTEVAAGVEMLYDFGEQNCGFWEFEVDAAAGTVIDLYAIEYIAPDGRLQHAEHNRNVMRYVCREGRQRFISLKRRSGRYLFLTVTNAARPARFNYLGLVESTYPVQRIGEFRCSDQRLNRIWEMSERTLKLCMEDTFTDCPLYEQTLWVGDARSEALFAFPVFGAYDLARRCIELAGRSLERYPLVGGQLPSSWDCLLPAWSFMWGMSVWDYYFETGDAEFVRKVWPMVRENLDGARAWVDPSTGLFSAMEWNMFDWCPTDCGQPFVLYLSMFMAGAVDAALKLAEVAGDPAWAGDFRGVRADLAAAIDRVWDAERGQWPDTIDADGAPATQGAVHTSMLAVLYDLTSPANRDRAAANVMAPPEEMIRVCSPFASLYYYMALEKLGREADVVAAIGADYREMLKLGESTVWETYLSPGDPASPDYFPTRSHCHGWSSAPLYFLPRIVLGVKAVGVGASVIEISPVMTAGIDYAAGRIATIKGPVEVEWERSGDRLTLRAAAPAGCRLEYRLNPTLEGLEVETLFAMTC